MTSKTDQANIDKNPLSNNRNLTTRGLKTTLPKSNIVRIEVLDGNARQRYLGSVQRAGDELKSTLYSKITSEYDNIFYGFIDTQKDSPSFNLHPQWESPDPSKTLLGGIKTVATSLSSALNSGLGEFVQGGITAGEGILNIAGRMSGINGSATGGGTLKSFKSVSLDDFTVRCGWYLPEQYNLCVKSLKSLYRMAYPKQLNVSDVDPGDVAKAVVKAGSEIKDAVIDGINAAKASPNKEVADAATLLSPSPEKSAGITESLTKKSVQVSLPIIFKLGEALGSNFTFNPLPVRVSYGQMMDIEPLVIQKVDTNFSKETFINGDGKHMPIFVETSITFAFWLVPAPRLQFASILGEEIFGDKPTVTQQPVPKEPAPKPKAVSNKTGYVTPAGNGVVYRNSTGDVRYVR